MKAPFRGATVDCCLAFGLRSSAEWLLHTFDMSIKFLEHFLIFWHKMFQGHFVPFLTPENYLFLRRGLVLFSGEWHLESNIMVVGILNATVFASNPLQWAEVKNTCFLHISVSLKNNEPFQFPILSIPTFT